MRTQHYLVGDRVHVSSGSFSGPITAGAFEILAQYAVEGCEPMYRLANLQGRDERMVPESELRSNGADMINANVATGGSA